MENRYGMTALGYSVIAAARAAEFVAKGKVPEVPLQTAFQCVAFLMSRGANPTQANEKGQDCFDIARNFTESAPRARRLLFEMLDSSKYEIDGGNVWLRPESEQKLRERVERELNGVMIEEKALNREHSEGRSGRGEVMSKETGIRLKNVHAKHDAGEVRRAKLYLSRKKVVGEREGYNPPSAHDRVRTGNRDRAFQARARESDGFREDALWPEHYRKETEKMPLKAREDHLREGRLDKDPENMLVKYYRSGIDCPAHVDGDIPDEERKKRDAIREEYLDSEEMRHKVKREARGAAKKGHGQQKARPSSAPSGGRQKSPGKYRPGYWTSSLPKYGAYAHIMKEKPRWNGRGGSTGGHGHYSQGSYPGMFQAKKKVGDRSNKASRQRPLSAGNYRRSERSGNGTRGGLRARPKSAEPTGRR